MMRVMINFEVVGSLTDIEIIAIGSAIRELSALQERFGHGRWRKLKGVARIRLPDGTVRLAELH